MAETDQSQEKTEQATPKRQADARRKGQTARSRDLTTMLVLLGSALTLWMTGRYTADSLMAMMHDQFTPARRDLFVAEYTVATLREAILTGLQAIAPFLTAMVAVALAAPLALGGWVMSGEQIKFDPTRLDPVKGMGRVFGIRGVTEMLKALAKFSLIAVVGFVVLRWQMDEIAALAGRDTATAVVDAFGIVTLAFFLVSAATLLIAAVDVPLQLWQHSRQLKMTRQEVKEEFKETDGRPEIKSRIRQLQQEVASRRMMEEVPRADVIITNPTHFAVALKYDPDRMAAPRVVASGSDHVAQSIRRIGGEHAVPTVEAPMLARALFHSTKVGREVPRELYLAVAQVLAYVFQLRDGRPAAAPPDPDVPPEFRF